MQVREIDLTNTRDVSRFIGFPFRLYQKSPLWVPPMVADMRLVMNPTRHPFYRHSEASFLVAESERSVIGRVAVLNHRRFNQYRQQNCALFYYFDVINDQQVCHNLLEAAAEWARKRGLTQIIGPKGFLQADGHGILVEGFEHPPAMGIPYNYPYYEALLTGCGFTKVTDYLSGYLNRQEGLPERYFQVAEQVRSRRGYTIKTFHNKAEMRAWIARIGDIYRESFMPHWEFCPPTDEEMTLIGERMIAVADPRIIKVVLKGDTIIGFVLAFPDISEGMRKAKGRLWPIGWWHLLRARKTTTWVNFNGVGILEPYQGSGANTILYTELTRALYEFQYQHADFIQVEERNIKSLGETRTIKVHWYKKHRVYRCDL